MRWISRQMGSAGEIQLLYTGFPAFEKAFVPTLVCLMTYIKYIFHVKYNFLRRQNLTRIQICFFFWFGSLEPDPH